MLTGTVPRTWTVSHGGRYWPAEQVQLQRRGGEGVERGWGAQPWGPVVGEVRTSRTADVPRTYRASETRLRSKISRRCACSRPVSGSFSVHTIRQDRSDLKMDEGRKTGGRTEPGRSPAGCLVVNPLLPPGSTRPPRGPCWGARPLQGYVLTMPGGWGQQARGRAAWAHGRPPRLAAARAPSSLGVCVPSPAMGMIIGVVGLFLRIKWNNPRKVFVTALAA